MWESILKIAPVFFSSMVKFIFGPVGGYVAGLHPFVTVLVTVGGAMTSVSVFTFLGSWLSPKIRKVFSKRRKKFSKKNRRVVKVWKKYGTVGVAVLMPLLLTPIGGTILAMGFGSAKDKIMLYMFFSSSVWSIVLTSVVYFFGKNIFPDFMGL